MKLTEAQAAAKKLQEALDSFDQLIDDHSNALDAVANMKQMIETLLEENKQLEREVSAAKSTLLASKQGAGEHYRNVLAKVNALSQVWQVSDSIVWAMVAGVIDSLVAPSVCRLTEPPEPPKETI